MSDLPCSQWLKNEKIRISAPVRSYSGIRSPRRQAMTDTAANRKVSVRKFVRITNGQANGAVDSKREIRNLLLFGLSIALMLTLWFRFQQNRFSISTEPSDEFCIIASAGGRDCAAVRRYVSMRFRFDIG